MPLKPYYGPHAGITIYHGDCREVLPQLSFDGIVTDPPYGIDLDVQRYGGSRVINPLNGARFARGGDKFEQFAGESEPMDLDFLFQGGELKIIWGANNWPQRIPFDPQRDGWICWDKRTNEEADKMLGSPFELAVLIGRRCYKIFRLQHGGAINADNTDEPRWHPTQKPIRLMQRILKAFLPERCACDPFMGSGTTLLAAKKLGYPATGIEIEEKYCEIAAKRLSQEVFDFSESSK